MAEGKKIPERTDTQETSVGSPVVKKLQCTNPTSPTKQRRSSNSEPEHQISLENKGSLKSDDEELTTSPTSDTSPTAFGTITLSSSLLSSSALPASPPDSRNPSKLIRAIRKRFGRADGESWESIREGASLFARATVSVADAANIPYLKGVAGVAGLILESADGAAANKEECARIAASVERLLVGLGARMAEMDGRVSKTLEEQVEQLTGILHQIWNDVKKLSDSKRGYFKKLARMERDREFIKRCDDKIRDAVHQF